MTETTKGDGWAIGSIDGMGEGPGFRKVRRELGVTAFGVNAVVLPPGYAGRTHYHDRQEELYLVHQGTIEFNFGEGDDATSYELGPGGLARTADPGPAGAPAAAALAAGRRAGSRASRRRSGGGVVARRRRSRARGGSRGREDHRRRHAGDRFAGRRPRRPRRQRASPRQRHAEPGAGGLDDARLARADRSPLEPGGRAQSPR